MGRRGWLTALGALVAFGVGVTAGRISERATPEEHWADVISVTAADNEQGAVRTSTRRLRLMVDVGGACAGQEETAGRIVQAGMRETPTTVRLMITVREGELGRGVCHGLELHRGKEVELERPLGRRRIVNLVGSVRVQRADDPPEFEPSGTHRLTQTPVLAVRSGVIRVVVRLNRALPTGARLQLDLSRALARLRPVDARRHCYVADIDADGDPEYAPHLIDARQGHHPRVTLLRADGRALDMRPGEVSRPRKATALITAPPIIGGLGC